MIVIVIVIFLQSYSFPAYFGHDSDDFFSPVFDKFCSGMCFIVREANQNEFCLEIFEKLQLS